MKINTHENILDDLNVFVDTVPEDDALTRNIIGAAIAVHRALGPGLLESAYEACLFRELQLRNLKVERQVALPINYRGVNLECGYRLDFVVENSVVLEIKTVKELLPVHEAQLLSYLKLSKLPKGLLINFHVLLLKNGIVRKSI